jgi:hypothetical protein
LLAVVEAVREVVPLVHLAVVAVQVVCKLVTVIRFQPKNTLWLSEQVGQVMFLIVAVMVMLGVIHPH